MENKIATHLAFATSHKPKIKAYDRGIWRRIFAVSIKNFDKECEEIIEYAKQFRSPWLAMSNDTIESKIGQQIKIMVHPRREKRYERLLVKDNI